jgi:Membrane domain of glycerophosphoryl diester phosphodiesterase
VIPVDIELRPLRLAEILDRIFQLYRARFLLFLGIAGVSTILELSWSLIRLGEVGWMTRHHLAVTTQQWATSVSSIPAWTVLFAAAALCLAASNRVVAAIYDGKPTGIVKAFAALRSGWLRYIWVNTLAFLIAWGSVIVIVVAGVTATLLATRARTMGQAKVAVFAFGAMGLLILLALPLCFWLTLRYSLAVPACIEEGLATLRSLKRSVFLTQDTKGRILVLLLIVMAAQGTLVSAFMSPVFAFIVRARGHATPAMTGYTLAVTALSSALIKPIYSIGLTLFYYDARVRKEGFDLERMLGRPSMEASNDGVAPIGPAV